MNLDDIYGPDVPSEELSPCSECGDDWPSSKLEDGVCPDCLLEQDYADDFKE